MEDKKPENPENEAPKDVQQAPADALSRTPEDLEEEEAKQAADTMDAVDEPEEKKVSPVKRFLRKINLYFLLFLVLVVGATVFMVLNYLNSQKPTPEAALASQALNEKALKQLANTDATVGNTSQTLTIQGNAIIAGQTLMRGNLNVAGKFQTGGGIQGPDLTISGKANLGETQTNNLQVATDLAVQGDTTVSSLSVAGAATFGGAVTVPELTVTRLVLSGNGVLEVPNHLSFSGPSPSRNITPGVLGAGGSASVNGSDTTGTVNINTGSGTQAGCFVQVNFNQPFSNQPHVIISPVGVGAGKTQYYVTRTNSSFSICTAAPAPQHQAFAFDYFVTN